MKIKGILTIAAMSAVLVSSAAFAEDEKVPVDVSGKLFFDYSNTISGKNKIKSTDTKGQDSFNLTRVYLQFDKKIDDIFSAKVTLDGANLTETGSSKNDSTDVITTKTSAAFVKNAYGQAKKDLGIAEVKIQIGLVGTPVIDLVDSLTGSRWIYQNYIDKSADLLGKTSASATTSLDAGSADTGVKAEIKILKMVSLTGMYSNGDGYKTLASDQVQTTKSTYGTLNINPIEALNFFGYYHYRDTASAKESENFISYYGGGVAWKDKSVKIGANYTLADGKTSDIKEKSNVMEVWANVNLQELTSVPVLLIGRYAMGTYEKNVVGAKIKNQGTAYWAGAGYQINKNVQIALMYKADSATSKTSGVKSADTENKTVYLKTEAVF